MVLDGVEDELAAKRAEAELPGLREEERLLVGMVGEGDVYPVRRHGERRPPEGP